MTRITTKEGAAIYATLEGNVLFSVDNADLTNLVPCSHEEADTRLLLHVAGAVKAGYRKACFVIRVERLGSHGSRTQKLRAHLETSCSCKMGSVTIPCQP